MSLITPVIQPQSVDSAIAPQRRLHHSPSLKSELQRLQREEQIRIDAARLKALENLGPPQRFD